MALWDITAVVEKREVMKTGLRTKATVPVTAGKKKKNTPHKNKTLQAKGIWEVSTSIIGSG